MKILLSETQLYYKKEYLLSKKSVTVGTKVASMF